MAVKRRPSFDTKSFLARVGDGRSISKYRKGQVVFSQGDIGDAVFYIQKGKVKLTVVSEQGKEALVAILGTDEFFGEGCLAGQVQRIATVTAVMDSVIGDVLLGFRLRFTVHAIRGRSASYCLWPIFQTPSITCRTLVPGRLRFS